MSSNTTPVVGPAARPSQWRWLVVPGLLLCFAFAALGPISLLATSRIKFTTPTFQLSWDLKHSENANWRVEEKQDGYQSYFVLHVPKGKDVGITPSFRWEVEGARWGVHQQGNWYFYLPLLWDGQRLAMEPGTTKPADSYANLPGRWRWQAEMANAAPNVFTWRAHFTHADANLSRQERRTVSVTVEVRED